MSESHAALVNMPSPRATNFPRVLLRPLAWTILFGLWLLIVAALTSYDPADWPGHAVAPYNSPVHNWAGRVGAYIAAELYLMMGPGIWISIAGGLAFAGSE